MIESDNNNAFVSMDETVRLICSYLGDDQASKLYVKVTRFLGLALDDLSLKVLPNIKSALLKINDNFTVDLPKDFWKISKVGVCCGREIRLLGRNHDLCKAAFPKDPPIQCCTCDKEEGSEETASDTDNCCPACTFHNFSGHSGSYLNEYPTYLYGYQPKNQFIGGTYDVDNQNGRLILGAGCDVAVDKELVVEYSATLTTKDYALIPREARTTLMHKVASQIGTNKQFDLRAFKREYYELKRNYDRYSLKDWHAAIRRGYKSSPER